MKKAIRIGLKIDTFLQGVILIFGAASLIAFFIEQRNGWIALIMFCFLGLYQTISGVTWSVVLKDKRRKKHLLHMIFYWLGYPVLFSLITLVQFIISYLFEPNPLIGIGIMALYIIGVPIYMAIQYFSITVQDMVRSDTSYIN